MKQLTLKLHVQPGAARDEIVGMHGDRIKVRIAAPPVEGRANRHLVGFLAEVFGVPRRQVALVRGESGRVKTVQIDAPTRIPPALKAATAAALVYSGSCDPRAAADKLTRSRE